MIFETDFFANFNWVDYILMGLLVCMVLIWFYFRYNQYKLTKLYLKLIPIVSLIIGFIGLIISNNLYVGGIFFLVSIFLAFYFSPSGIFGKKIKNKDQNNAKKTAKEQAKIQERKEERKEKYQMALTQGIEIFESGDYHLAAEKFIKALKYNDYSAKAWYYIGLINMKRSRWKQAETSFTRALERDSDHLDARKCLKEVKANLSKLQNDSQNLDETKK
ncbi:MAG: tetratricopeptide repeat protein [Promethearchaeota archaeon]